MDFTLESTTRLAEELRAIPPKDPAKRRLDKQAVINEIKQEVIALQQRGYTIEEVAEMLRGRGFEITTPTLKNYLQRAKSLDGKGPKARPAGPRRARAERGEVVTSTAHATQATERAAHESPHMTPAVPGKADASAKPTSDPVPRSGKGAFLSTDRESY
jgi:hypothetical protein